MTRTATQPVEPQDQARPIQDAHPALAGQLVVQLLLSSASAKALKPFARATAINLLQRSLPRGEMDLIREFAGPLSLIVLGRLTGIPPEDRRRLQNWCEAVETASIEGALPSPIRQDMLDTLRKLDVDQSTACYGAWQKRVMRQWQMPDDEALASIEQVIGSAREGVLHLVVKGALEILRGRARRDWLLRDPENRIGVTLLEVLGHDPCWQRASPLALMEAEVALAALVLRAPDLRLAAVSDTLAWSRDVWGSRPSELRLAFRRTN